MKIYWEKALKLLNAGKKITQSEIDFKKEHIPVNEVVLFNEYKIRVPENLIFYDDDNIDCNEIPEITEDDIDSGKIQWIKMEEFPLDKEVRKWIIKQNINLNELIPQLLKNFYQTMKAVQKNAAV
ncbi:MAG: hypothetical protein A2033_07245 [Bacteroidetes bacterium GWA2_31_9]|nr:MAG: hypothetical protein A2033_07245 [Bacteroidetes bacterium GWA2_31_9]